MRKLYALALCFAVLCALPVLADQWNKRTVITFGEAVELPGVVLPPGTYVFKLFDSMSNRNIVQVFNEDETHIYATILAIPNYRLEPAEKTVVRFDERPVQMPEALKAWFYPGDNFGQEFVYPKVRATELAKEAKEPVLSAEVKPNESPEEMIKAPVVAITPEEQEVEVTTVIEPKPVEAPVTEVEPVTPPPEPAPPVETLPKTAGELPLLALAGLGALSLAAAIRAGRKRS